MFAAFVFAVMIEPTTAAPSVTPSPRPTASPAPYAMPQRYYNNLTFNVRPISPTRVAVYVKPIDRYAIAIMPTNSATGPTPSPTPSPRATPYDQAEAFVIALSVTWPDGQIETVGAEDVDRTFHLPHALTPNDKPYVLTARWRDAPDHAVSVRYLVAAVPDDAGTRIGDLYVQSGRSVPYHIGTMFRLVSIQQAPPEHRAFTLQDDPSVRVSYPEDYDSEGIVPAVTDRTILALRKQFIGVPILADGVPFACYNDRSPRGVGRGKLLPGKTLRIVSIVRAAHIMRFIGDDPRLGAKQFCGNCDEPGTFVDSPLIIRLAVDTADVEMIPPDEISGSNPFNFGAGCESGYRILQDVRQFRNSFVVAPNRSAKR